MDVCLIHSTLVATWAVYDLFESLNESKAVSHSRGDALTFLGEEKKRGSEHQEPLQ